MGDLGPLGTWLQSLELDAGAERNTTAECLRAVCSAALAELNGEPGPMHAAASECLGILFKTFLEAYVQGREPLAAELGTLFSVIQAGSKTDPLLSRLGPMEKLQLSMLLGPIRALRKKGK